MALWVFGDSFSIPHDYEHEKLWKYDTNWIKELKTKLDITEVRTFVEFGVSNEWIFKHAIENAGQFQQNDCVIFQLTNADRHWFFEDKPAESNLVQLNNPNWDKNQTKAVEYYLKYLYNDNFNNIVYSSIIYSLMYIQSARPDVKMLILPGWGAAPGVVGNLVHCVSDPEFSNKNVVKQFYEKTGFDPRLNHMTIDNHYILSNKIADYFTTGQTLDLTSGFISNIYTEENI